MPQIVSPSVSSGPANITDRSGFIQYRNPHRPMRRCGRVQGSQVEGEPPNVYKAGDSFYEPPGAHHLYSRNASTTEPASLLAAFVVDTNDKLLITPDK